MKFEQQLECLALPKFRGYYLNYKELKRAVDVFTGQEKDQATVQEVTHWTSSFLRLGPNPEVTPEAKLRQILERELERVSKFADLEAKAIKTQLDKLQAEAVASRGQGQETLLASLETLGDNIVDLKGFALLNFTGFRKILKKYDKWSKSSVLPWFMAQVVKAPLMTVDFDAFVSSLNRCAVAIGPRPPTLQSPTSVDHKIQGSLVFLVDPQDAMRVRVELAKHLVLAPPPAATSELAKKARTSAVYFDTPDLAVYSAHTVGVPGTDEAADAAVRSPCDSVHVRYSKEDTATLVYEAKGAVAPLSVTLAKAQVNQLFKGEPVRVPDAKAAAALASVAQSVRSGLRPVAIASYNRSSFTEQQSGLSAVLEEDIKLSSLPPNASWDSTPTLSEHFPYGLLSISVPAQTARQAPRWLEALDDIATLIQVSGFNLGIHTEAQFRAKRNGMPMPHWYRSVVNGDDTVEGASQSDAHERSEPEATPSVSRPSPVYDFGGAARLLHEFGTAPEVEAAAASRRIRTGELTTPAADADSLQQPLLAGSAEPGGEPEASAKPVAAKPVRNAIVAVQPKTLFSNERTFLDWIHFAVMYAALGIACGQAATAQTGVILGRCLVVFSMLVVAWSWRQFTIRADALDGKEIIDFADPVGPPVLMIGLLLTLVCSTLHAAQVI